MTLKTRGEEVGECSGATRYDSRKLKIGVGGFLRLLSRLERAPGVDGKMLRHNRAESGPKSAELEPRAHNLLKLWAVECGGGTIVS